MSSVQATTSGSFVHSIVAAFDEVGTTSETKTIALTISQSVTAPKLSSYMATLLVNIGQIPPTVYHTTAQRWYKFQLTGSQADPANQGWFLRVEPVMVTMSDSLASKTSCNIIATPLQ
jgi:hypothetical protein